ncbi:gamma-glutamyltransferase [Pseudooceanicola nanhaiensis]|uniref:gamma-glutamyltransferase n=1 Tax=Pseudooceanicola nanhaiensis TaxID=375761 RepID=UPI001CD19B96|nr:gamma-glutamyltransferase [Pseudooceanicola nanhaiensis]MCA0920354.1 gamma-glutamyltransferase [Pseudooceanicola nanhaiensis]
MTASPYGFTCKKQPATGAKGMVVTNHPLGSSAGAQMLAAGGNAVDAAVAGLLALTVVEPMMVGIAGGGLSHLRLPDGRHIIFDGLAQAAGSMTGDLYTPQSDNDPALYMEVEGRRNRLGASAVAVPGNLAAWYAMHSQYGKLPWADVVEPAIGLAARGFLVTPYLRGAIDMHRPDMELDPVISSIFLPGGQLPQAGDRIVMGDYAESLREIQKHGAAALHGGALGKALVERMASGDDYAGFITLDDLTSYAAAEREAIHGSYRGWEIVGPPPPASSGVHVTQMLNMLEHFDVKGMGFGSPEMMHLLAEVIRVGFEDRRAASGDPAFVDVPVERYTSKEYAAECLSRLRNMGGIGPATPGYESNDTTHVTMADDDGMIVAATHTINGLFGANIMVPGTGIIPNNYMCNFDPHPGKALSIVPGKRVPTSMAPMIALKDGAPEFAIGLPGGLRIFPSAMQAMLNLIDHGMDPQTAVEAPRLWTQGQEIELEPAYAHMQAALEAKGHTVKLVRHIGGGMSVIRFGKDGLMTGAACWRADGTPMALGGGLAEAGIRFNV